MDPMVRAQAIERWISGVGISALCVFGLFGNSITLVILNVNREMRKQPINVYLTVLALYDNGVLFNAILMLAIPNIYKLLSSSAQAADPTIPISSTLGNQSAAENILWSESVNNLSESVFFYADAFNQSLLITNPSSSLGGEGGEFNGTLWSALSNDTHANSADHPVEQDPLHLYIRVVYPLALISQTGSIWTTCLITAERYLAVCHPLRALTLSTRTRAVWALLIMTFCALLFNAPRFAEVELVEVDGVTAVQPSALRRNNLYYYLYYICLHLSLLYIVPLTLLSVLNIKIYAAVRKATRDRSSLTRHQQSELNIASMLVLLVAIFIACNAPAFIVNCLEITGFRYFQVAISFSNLFVCFNSSVNFIIYCIFGKKFKEKLKEVFHCRVVGLRERERLKNTANRNQYAASFVAETFV